MRGEQLALFKSPRTNRVFLGNDRAGRLTKFVTPENRPEMRNRAYKTGKKKHQTTGETGK
jgi:hypothetical protein